MFSRLIKKILRDRAISLCVDMQVYSISEQRNINSLKVKTVRKIITIDIHQTEYEWGGGSDLSQQYLQHMNRQNKMGIQ